MITIDKSQVLEILQKSQDDFNSVESFTRIYNDISALPEARLMAEWQQIDDIILCSHCGARINEEQYTYSSRRFCPSCGAYMKKLR